MRETEAGTADGCIKIAAAGKAAGGKTVTAGKAADGRKIAVAGNQPAERNLLRREKLLAEEKQQRTEI